MKPVRTGMALLATATVAAVAGFWFGSYTRHGLAPTTAARGVADPDADVGRARWIPGDRSAARDESASPVQAPSARALAQRIDEATALSAAHERDRALEVALERLTRLDPGAALARARSLDPVSARRLVPEVIGAWSQSDLESAAQAAFVLEPASLRFAAAREILRRRSDLSSTQQREIAQQLAEPEATEWLLLESRALAAPSDAATAIAEAIGMAGQRRRHERLDRIARLVALQSPVDALTLANDIRDPRDRAAYQRSVADTWAESDPVSAAQWLEGQPLRVRRELAGAVAVQYARSDPRAALEWASRVDSSPEQGAWTAWTTVIATIAETDPHMAVETAIATPDRLQRQQGSAVALAFLARKNPQLAATYLDRISAGNARSEATVQIALQMARQFDPIQALDWLSARNDPGAVHQGRMSIASQWATHDPEAAFRFTDRLQRQQRGQWLRVIVPGLTAMQPDRVLDLVMSLHSDPDFPHTVAVVAEAIASRDPELAMELASRVSDSGQRDQVLTNIIPQLARRSPEDAVSALDRVGNETQRESLTPVVAQMWAQSDADGALDWVRSLPAGASRDQSYASLIPSMTSLREMESAIRRIQAPDVRSHAVLNAALVLARGGKAEEARELVFRHPLDPAMMQTLETQLQSGQDISISW